MEKKHHIHAIHSAPPVYGDVLPFFYPPSPLLLQKKSLVVFYVFSLLDWSYPTSYGGSRDS